MSERMVAIVRVIDVVPTVVAVTAVGWHNGITVINVIVDVACVARLQMMIQQYCNL